MAPTSERRVGKRAEQKRRWDREHKYNVCWCGERKLKKAAVCRACDALEREDQHAATLEYVEEMYLAGLPLAVIAQQMGRAGPNSINKDLDELRKAGRIGYRYPGRTPW